jgi:hypothetical protein
MILVASLSGYAQISTDPLVVALKTSYEAEAKGDYQAAI